MQRVALLRLSTMWNFELSYIIAGAGQNLMYNISREKRNLMTAIEPGLSSHKATSSDSLDNYDIAILSALSTDPRMTMVELAKIVHLSRTAIARRLMQLKDAGVLLDTVDMISYSTLGLDISAVIGIWGPCQNIDKSRQELLQMPEVLSVSTVSGGELLIARAVATNMAHLCRFVESLGRFGNTTTKLEFRKDVSRISLKDRLRMLRNRDAS